MILLALDFICLLFSISAKVSADIQLFQGFFLFMTVAFAVSSILCFPSFHNALGSLSSSHASSGINLLSSCTLYSLSMVEKSNLNGAEFLRSLFNLILMSATSSW